MANPPDVPGLDAPFSIPAAAFRKYELGGEVVTKENERSDWPGETRNGRVIHNLYTHTHTRKHAYKHTLGTYVDGDPHWDWDALLNIFCLFIEVFTEGSNVHPPLEQAGKKGKMVQTRQGL